MFYTPPHQEYQHFSAEVRIELRANDKTFRVASLGPDEIILHDGQYPDIAVMDAEISLFVDGAEFRWPVHLPEGAVPFSLEIFMVPLGAMVRVDVKDNPTGRTHSA